MSLKHFMADQMRKPSGWFGSVILRHLLNRMNMAIVESTLARVDLQSGQRVLEIGFGGGAAIALVAKRLGDGVVTGIDFSPEMVQKAQLRFRGEIARGNVCIRHADIVVLPFPAESFDRIFTI